MNRESIIQTLKRWQEVVREADLQMEALGELVGMQPESQLQSAVSSALGAYTELVASTVDWPDDALMDWWLSHNFGERPMIAGLTDEPMRVISTIEDLAQLIADDLARACTEDR